jgi:glycosyltransferase involved in cell wall biosynthesis
VASARTAGLKASDSDYVLPLDADDRLAPGALTRLAAVLDSRPEVDAVWGSYQQFGEAMQVQRTAPFLDPWQVSYQNDLPATALFRRSAVLNVGGWEPTAGGYEDWDLWMALAEAGCRGIGLDEVIYLYRRHGPRRLRESRPRHAHYYRLLKARHPALFAQRRRNWRRSPAPRLLRLALPVIGRLPPGSTAARVLSGAACHLAYRRGVRPLVWRLRSG